MTTITTPPVDVPDITDPINFASEASAWVAWLTAAVPQINTVTAEVNADKVAAEAAATTATSARDVAISASNYAGNWGDLTGSLSIPASVSHSGKIWLLTTSLADVTAAEPGVSGNWTGLSVLLPDGNGNLNIAEEVQATCYLETKAPDLTGATPTIDCDEGNYFSLTTSANTTFTFSYAGINLTADDVYSFTLRLTAGGTHTLTWPAAVRWPGGTAPDAPASGETDVYNFFTDDSGTTWFGALAMDAVS